MRCTRSKTVGFLSDGKTLCWSPSKYSKEYPTFQLPCGQCLSCRLERARETAVRCVHEASLYQNNSFITLTYSDNYLKSHKLQYTDAQNIIKKIRNNIFADILEKYFPDKPQSLQRTLWRKFSKERRKEIYEPYKISCLTTGEYGDQNKRPHWHILIFNWRPTDQILKYTSKRGDHVFSSKILDDMWERGITEIGDVTFESAGYCARYAAKKLVHGRDGHEYEPISRRSSKQAIGKKWIEKYHEDVFNYGCIVLPTGKLCGIPRYYEKWYKQHHPEKWKTYVTLTKLKKIKEAISQQNKQKLKEAITNSKRSYLKGHQITRDKVRENLLKAKFKTLTDNHKL